MSPDLQSHQGAGNALVTKGTTRTTVGGYQNYAAGACNGLDATRPFFNCLFKKKKKTLGCLTDIQKTKTKKWPVQSHRYLYKDYSILYEYEG